VLDASRCYSVGRDFGCLQDRWTGYPSFDFCAKYNITLLPVPQTDLRNPLKNGRWHPPKCNRTDILLRLLAGLTWAVMTPRGTFRFTGPIYIEFLG
jgi:hypothetical protein